MIKKHVIISGTGRSGTTFLIQLLTFLGLDTGFKDITSHIFSNCNAGMETNIRNPHAPYIIKDPWLCDNLDEILMTGNILIEKAFIPVRDLYSAAQSRIEVTNRSDPEKYPKGIPGGLWHTDKPDEQEGILVRQLYNLIYSLAKHDIPVTFLYFPRIVQDSHYLYKKLEYLLKDMTFEIFNEAFRKVAQPELVHDFTKEKK